MAKKNNYYVVRKGRVPGIYETWDECREQVNGFKGCEYMGFVTLEDAEKYYKAKDKPPKPKRRITPEECRYPNDVLLYTDGSYDHDKGVYGWGYAVVVKGELVYSDSGAGQRKDIVEMRNVAGETLAAIEGMKYIVEHGYQHVMVCYDYYGIEKWATGEWSANKPGTIKYSAEMRRYKRTVQIMFRKVMAHSGEKYNEYVDKLAGEAVENFQVKQRKKRNG